VTLKSPDGRDWSTVLETIDAKNPQRVSFAITGGLSQATIHVWETNSQKTFAHVADLTPQDARFTFSFAPGSLYSLTTTTGQGRGGEMPPAQKPFPIPYRDNFENVELERAPRFLSDQNGAFEVRPCSYRSGRCLEQVITAKPIPWGPLPDPFTLAGEVSWSDYRIACDVYLSGSGPATLMGRVDSADVFRDGNAIWPSGYILRFDPAGKWALSSTAYNVPTQTLASGSAHFLANRWHRAELQFQGKEIAVLLDKQQLARVTDSSHSAGMFAIGTGWNRAQFDNLSVTKQ